DRGSRRSRRNRETWLVGGLGYEVARERAGLRRRLRLNRGVIDVGEDREVRLALAARHGEPDRFLERIGGVEQQLDDFVGGRAAAAAQVVEQVFHPVREIGDAAVA